ncbi:WbqC family protein [Stenotrophomonas sp. DR822]|uniref:WbqC family protein n=1 Tax=Stenotrophomonas sp. DR822 TaxID=2871174 RepID=UPI001C97E7FB|nr:WbqC family protein [Stenotrophomonas sp. DR822]QZN82697.1 WbqC family protein [Stenotrophomonas sp. DR822]
MTNQKRIAVLQSSYIPWKGYFDIIHDVDAFIFYDDVQFTYQDWRSRNRVIANGSPVWLTVPTGSDIKRLINEVKLPNKSWQRKHWSTIRHAYTKSPFFHELSPRLEELFLERQWDSLSEMNQHMTQVIARDLLGIKTEFLDSRAFSAEGSKLDRLINLLQKAGATHYLSGPAARSYIDPDRFAAAGIELEYKDYSGYPTYKQYSNSFEHAVSILDLLFNAGPDAPHYIWGWRSSGVSAGGQET